MEKIQSALSNVLELGGPVVAILGVISILTLAVVIYKLWQMSVARVGHHMQIQAALAAWDRGDNDAGITALKQSRSYLAPLVQMAIEDQPAAELRNRLEAEAETRFQQLESGLRLLDSVAQIAPLLGLFGTVLGMIEAFQALQEAGTAVDPSLLAGGIWVALLTTAVGLAVAMPTSLVLSWFDARMARERIFANVAFNTILTPRSGAAADGVAHAA